MPKKSKRRATAGKSAKVRKSDTSVVAAGLTAGAVSMFAQRAMPMESVTDEDDLFLLVNCNEQVFSKDAPRVQILHILDNVSAEKEKANFAVSDGTHLVWAAVTRGVEGMINGKALVENSIVQVKRCTMFNFESGEYKMLLSHVKVLDRNFGSMIGNPLPFTEPPILRPAPAPSSDGNT